MGIGDLVVVGVIFPALGRLGCPAGASFGVPASGLILALVVGLTSSPIHAVPFMALPNIAHALLRRRQQDQPPTPSPSA